MAKLAIALVLGGAACLAADLEGALGLGEYDGVVACNDAGAWWPGPLDAHCSIHGDKLERIWRVRRARNGFPPASREIAKDDRGSHLFPGQVASGSSGLMALKVALEDLGFDRAVLCGIPMDEQAHFYGGQAWRGANSHRAGWRQVQALIRDRARSMSGWTAGLLGGPTQEWVAGL